jgi:hypothetical protein
VAFAVTVTVPLTVLPLIGVVTETTGGVVSDPGVLVVTGVERPETFPAASYAATVYV